MRQIGIARLTALLAAFTLAAPTQASAEPATRWVSVVGEWVNDWVACPGSTQGPGTPPAYFDVRCTFGATWTGGWDGQTLGTLEARIYLSGDMEGSYEEWFYGIAAGYRSPIRGTPVGGMLHRGTFSITGGRFRADAKIVRGTCAFAGSKGSATFVGDNAFTGKYVGTWRHRSGGIDPTCDPTND